tara:strand:+ start:465 stop:719 length:255 start_codon:yes stop_codon:yes gene_type:complete
MIKKWLLIDYNEAIDIMEFDFQDDLMNYFNINVNQCDDYTDALCYKELFEDNGFYGVKVIEIEQSIGEDFNKIEIKTSKQLINK